LPAVYFNYQSDRELQDFYDYRLPNQLVKLVKQAQRHESFDTDPHISVGADMREKLRYPLTLEQAQAIGDTGHMAEENSIHCALKSHAYVDDVLCATVIVSIDYRCAAKGIEVHCREVPIYIKCAGNRKRLGLEILSVEPGKAV